jgi:hypothetical protein
MKGAMTEPDPSAADGQVINAHWTTQSCRLAARAHGILTTQQLPSSSKLYNKNWLLTTKINKTKNNDDDACCSHRGGVRAGTRVVYES